MKKLLLILFFPTLLFGQTENPKKVQLTFKEAVKIGLNENVLLKQAGNQLEIQQAIQLREKSRYLPDVSATSTFRQIDGQQFNQVQGEVAFTKSNNLSAGIDARINVFEGFGRIKSIKQANYDFQAQSDAVERAKQQLIFDISQQYLQILLSQELLRIAEDNLIVQTTTLDQIQGQVDAGSLAKPDLYTQQAQVQQLEVQKIRSGNDLRISKTNLMQTLLLEPVVEIEPVEPNWNINEIIATGYNLNEMYETALKNRPDYNQTVNTVKSNQLGIGVASAGYYPTLSAFWSYGTNYSNLVANASQVPNGEFEEIGYLNGDPSQPVISSNESTDRVSEEVPFNDQFFDANPATVLGLRLDIPLFDRFQTRTSRTIARLQHDNAILNEKNLKRTIFLDVQNAYLDFEAAKTDYYASQKQFTAAEKALEVQKERYELGVGNLVELSQANNLYVQGAASKAQSEYTLYFQKVILDFVLGTLNFEDIPD